MGYLSTMAHRGDPGFFGSIGRALGGATVGFLTGGPAGAVLGAAGGLVGQSQAGTPASNAALLGGPQRLAYGSTPGLGMPSSYPPQYPPPPGLPHVPGPVGPVGYPMPTGRPQLPPMTGMGCPSGYRLNKSSYFLRNGTFVPARSKCVRYRTRNNLNQRALRRAISRAQGFHKLVQRNRKGLRALARV